MIILLLQILNSCEGETIALLTMLVWVAFTMVAISVFILIYVPPDKVPLPSSLQGSIDSVSLEYGGSDQDRNGEQSKVKVSTTMDSDKPFLVKTSTSRQLYVNSPALTFLSYACWASFL